jgi:hemoglobin/transferrin/lactoferrin receptor protein
MVSATLAPPLAAQTTLSPRLSSNEADVLQLPAVVVSATRTERLINETPGTVVSVNLAGDPITDFSSLVRNKPLVDVPFQAFGTDSFVPYQRGGNLGYNLRGIEGNRVLIQVDGVRAPDEFTLGGSEPTGRDYLETELLERVEILQGSASALYGTDAIGGVVSFTTKSPETLLQGETAAADYKLAYASVNSGLTHTLTAAAQQGSFGALVSYTRRDASETENHGSIAPNPAELSSDAYLAKLVWSPSPAHRLTFTAEYLDRSFDVDIDSAEGSFGFLGTIDRVFTESLTERFRLSLDYRLTPVEPTALIDNLTASLYTQDSVARDINQQVRVAPATRIRDTETAFNNDTIGASLNATKNLQIGDASHRFTYGIEFSETATDKTFERVQQTTAISFTDAPRMADTDTTRMGFYAQDEIEWEFAGKKKLLVIPGLRIDRFELEPHNSPAYLRSSAGELAPDFSDTALAPKLAVLGSITPSLNAYFQYNHGYRYPSAEELTATFTNVAFGYKSVPNPNLQPETSDSYELGLKGNLGSPVEVQAAIFYNTYNNFIDQFLFTGVPDPNFPAGIFQTRNVSEAEIKGIDITVTLLGAEFSPALANWTARTTFGWHEGESSDDGTTWTPLASIAPWEANTSLNYAADNGRWGASLEFDYVAAKSAADSAQDPATAFLPPAYTLFNLVSWWQVREHITLRLGLYNLTDEKYWRYNSVRGVRATSTSQLERRTQPGFNAAASLRFRF